MKNALRHALRRALAVGLILAGLLAAVRLFPDGGGVGETARAQWGAASDIKVSGGIATLYARDPVAHALCFSDGREGSMILQGQVFNRCSHLDFNNYYAGNFTVGIQGGEEGLIVDLGTAEELKQRYGYQETVGNGQGFASLRAESGRVFVLKDYRARTSQELKEGQSLFTPAVGQDASPKQTAPVKVGHIYLARIFGSRDKSLQILVKILVLTHVPGESVTLRWEVI
ncbi:MAG TPA: hypothetical protein VF538_08315 [Pyrinomonadaceae bacterium]|jgi:hypothetical protein